MSDQLKDKIIELVNEDEEFRKQLKQEINTEEEQEAEVEKIEGGEKDSFSRRDFLKGALGGAALGAAAMIPSAAGYDITSSYPFSIYNSTDDKNFEVDTQGTLTTNQIGSSSSKVDNIHSKSLDTGSINNQTYVPASDGISGINDAIEKGATIYLEPQATYGGAKLAIDQNNVIIYGNGATLKNTHNGDIIELQQNPSATGTEDVVLKNLRLDGNKANQTSGRGIVTTDQTRDFRFEDVRIFDCNGEGVYLDGSYEGIFNHVTVNDSDTHGFYTTKSSSGTDSGQFEFMYCETNNLGGDGFHLDQCFETRFFGGEYGGNRGGFIDGQCFSIYLYGMDFEGYDTTGCRLNQSNNKTPSDVQFYGARFKGNFGNPTADYGLFVEGASRLQINGIRTDGHNTEGLDTSNIPFGAKVLENNCVYNDSVNRRGAKQHHGNQIDSNVSHYLAQQQPIYFDGNSIGRIYKNSSEHIEIRQGGFGSATMRLTSGGKIEFRNGGSNIVVTSDMGGSELTVQDLSGVSGNTTGETRTDDGTNTNSGDPALCVWTGSEWKVQATGNTFT
jgi:MoCo/4Fe-4S cofactor protein with predicted Tat translocation signal